MARDVARVSSRQASSLGRAAAALLVSGLALAYGITAPSLGSETFVDEAIIRRTVDLMRGGMGYYPAMNRALRSFTGTPSSVRSFREPTIFMLWRVLPGPAGRWWLFVGMVAATALLVVAFSRAWWVAPVLALYLLHAGRPYANGWHDQYLIVELWTVLPVMVLLAARAWDMPRLMAASAVVAALIRELSVVLVLGGLLGAIARRRHIRLWLVAAASLIPFAVLHTTLAAGYTSSHGTEAKLFGTGGIDRIATMAAVGLPLPKVAVAALWVAALARLAIDPELLTLVGGYVAIPLLGLAVGRDYWGYLVVPFVLVWAAEGLTLAAEAITTRRSRRSVAVRTLG